ncbi:Ger(x)C family spore germination protein [Thalassorhabdus alkalitolerans]|uniref:Ger(X)C family spore germination protein n=1 Tax=Thalassorhabdus alkalitolerans TaxID=2282697 RepID=A0ABW0YSN6_9BACI
MIRKFSLLLLCILLLLTGCWNVRELDELSIASMISIDKSDENKYEVTAQIINPAQNVEEERTDRAPVATHNVSGASVFEGIRRLTTHIPRKLFLAHIRVVVISEEIAEEDFTEVLDFFFRDHGVRTDFLIVISKDQPAKNVLKVSSRIEELPAEKVFSSITFSEENWAPTKGMQIDDIIEQFILDGQNPVVTGIKVVGDQEVGGSREHVETIETEAVLKLHNLAAFREGKLVGWMTEDQSIGYNYIRGNVQSTLGVIPCNNDNITYEVIRSESSIDAKLVNGEPMVNVTISTEGNIAEVTCDLETSPQTIKKLEKQIANNIETMAISSINRAQTDFKSDIFGFGEQIRRSDPTYWKSVKNDWNTHFEDLEVNVAVDFSIHHTGTVTDSLINDKKN